MEKDKKRGIRKLLNIFDLAVIIIVAAAVAFLYLRARSEKQEETPEHVVAVTDDTTVRYTVEISGITREQAEYIQPGQAVREKTELYDFGVVESVEIGDSLADYYDYENLVIRRVPVPGKYTVRVTVTADCVRGADGIYLDGSTAIYAGYAIDASYGSMLLSGHVINVERSDG